MGKHRARRSGTVAGRGKAADDDLLVVSGDDAARILSEVDACSPPYKPYQDLRPIRATETILPLPCGSTLVMGHSGSPVCVRTAPEGSWFAYTLALENVLRLTITTLEGISAAQGGDDSGALSRSKGKILALHRALSTLSDRRRQLPSGNALLSEIRPEVGSSTDGFHNTDTGTLATDGAGTHMGDMDT